ncbi:hypothetical protein ACP70R_031389 [Stipagrostis hirtigluma subsp. patula]
MDRYSRVAPARPVCLSSAGTGGHLRQAPAGRRSGGAEIGIFTAERYFSAADVVRRDAAFLPALPDDEPSRLSVAPDVVSQSGRTAASSEASWNSRSGLLSAAARQMGSGGGGGAANASDQCYRGRKPGSGQRWMLCPCAGRKAVTVDAASEPRSPTPASIHARYSAHSTVEECLESMVFKVRDPSPPRPAAEEPVKVKVTPGSRAFPLAADNVLAAAGALPNHGASVPFAAAFPADVGRRVVSSGGFTSFPPVLGAARVTSSAVDEPPRDSLEVFRPIDEDSVVLAGPPPPTTMLVGGRGAALARVQAMAAAEEDAMSDASSDLFDLESFAASSSYPTTYRGRGSRRNSADDDLPYASLSAAAAAAAAEPALSECMYAPSEASVVWSVATAEGGAFDAASMANFSSAASACCVDDFRFVVPEESAAGFTAAMSRSAGRKKGDSGGSGGFLSSCRCEKAVSVGPTPVRMVKPPVHPGTAAKAGGAGGEAQHRRGRVHATVRT